jgi:RNase H-like domain found in reverse transcriptase
MRTLVTVISLLCSLMRPRPTDPRSLLKYRRRIAAYLLPVQRHEPLAFLASEFKDTSFNWSTAEKEAFPIVQTFKRLDYILAGNSTELHTDHRNLIYIFDPHGLNPSVPRHVASKLMRWAFKMCAFRCIVNHIYTWRTKSLGRLAYALGSSLGAKALSAPCCLEHARPGRWG